MNQKRKGFTLIELLAVIVILGLLMAIAIPSVTKYITQSRKKTVSTTIGNYIGALTNQVNDMEYTFTAANTVYAVPIECISLERGGTNPFGKWHQASNAYWAYVLVQYDDATSSYTYGFTFKDSAGYGLYPTTSEKLNESGSQISTDLDLTRPTNGTITNITAKANWTGFDVQDNTSLVVLEATSEGEAGNGTTTCTLCQKGDNYAQVEEEKQNQGGSVDHNGDKIPVGATYITVDGQTLTAGDDFPVVSTGDIYKFGDYEYGYNMQPNDIPMGDDSWWVNTSINGWGVKLYDRTKSSYGEILGTINKKPLKTMVQLFYSCSNLVVAPDIPDTVTSLFETFGSCTSLTTVKKVPSSVTNMASAFSLCNNLTGTIEINANPATYYNCFSVWASAKNITFTGSSTMLKTLAQTSRTGYRTIYDVNGNVLMQ